MPPPLYIPVTPTIMAGSLNFMKDSASTAEALFIKLNCLPSLHNRFQQLLIDVTNSSQTLRDTALTAKMALETNLKALAYIESELNNAEHIDNDILAERANLPAKAKSKLRELKVQLSAQLSNIKSPLPSRLTQEHLKEFKKDQIETEAALLLLSNQKTKLQEQRQILKDAIDALSQGSPEAIKQNDTVTLQSLAQLGMSSPHIAVILLAINQMKETIGTIGEGIRYKDMVKQRDALVSKITDQSTSIASKQKQIVALKGKIQFIDTLHTIDDLLKIYSNEYQHVIDNFESFTAQADTDFKNNAQQLITLLTPISNPW